MIQDAKLPSPVKVAALEKIQTAASRMGISVSQAYREIKSLRVGPLVKLGRRASALPSSSVDAWIAARIAEASAGAKQGAQPERGRPA